MRNHDSKNIVIPCLCLATLSCSPQPSYTYRALPPVWKDTDDSLHNSEPASFYSSYTWDGADNAIFRPLAEFWQFETKKRALNINAMDEVPNSSWYVNRLSVQLLSPGEVARGACPDLNDELPPPITVVGGKPDGANPGFQIVDGAGNRYLLKTGGLLQKERPGAADVIGAAIYHAAGYHVPCNRVINFERKDLVLEEGATVKYTTGRKEPLSEKAVEAVLAKAAPTGIPGVYRASVSQFIEGKPISPWRYHSTREDDPNDVIPHEHRRELRGMYVFSAWTGHVDARQENTLAAWVEGEENKGHVRHYVIDFGDCFGVVHKSWDEINRRLEHSGYLDLGDIFMDFVTFGFRKRPWDHSQSAYGPAGADLAYFDAGRFVADKWKTGYPNNAYDRMTEADAAWAARIMSRFSDAHIRALVARGRFSATASTAGDSQSHSTRSTTAAQLEKILRIRRDKILERWLTQLSPLTWPEVENKPDKAELCLEDLLVSSKRRKIALRHYAARAYHGASFAISQTLATKKLDAEHMCVELPATLFNKDYLVVDVFSGDSLSDQFPLRAHFITKPQAGVRLVGLERPRHFELKVKE